MWFLLLLGGMALAGCGAVAHARRVRLPVFAAERDSPLYEPARRAARAWADATGLDVRVDDAGNVPIFFVDQLSGCNDEPGSEACSFKGNESRIEVLSSTPASHLELLILHEMGHHLRGEAGHITSNPLAVMATPIRGNTITRDDVDYVCQAQGCGG